MNYFYWDASALGKRYVAEQGSDLPLDRDWLATVTAAGEVAAVLHDHRAPVLASLLVPYARRLVVAGPGLAVRGAVGPTKGSKTAHAPHVGRRIRQSRTRTPPRRG